MIVALVGLPAPGRRFVWRGGFRWPGSRPRPGRPLAARLYSGGHAWPCRRPGRGRRTLVVFTASGGASRPPPGRPVPPGCPKRYGTPFPLGRLVSAVSAVPGAPTTLPTWNLTQVRGGGHRSRRTRCGCVNDQARRSSLEASAWGIGLPDLPPALLPPLVPAILDRGWSIEQPGAVAAGVPRPPGRLRLGDDRAVRTGAPAGRRVFHATLRRDRQRLVIAPFPQPRSRSLAPPFPVLVLGPCFRRRRGRTPGLGDVRLSATFPSSSPSRARGRPRPPAPADVAAQRFTSRRHVVDGGS